MGITFPCEIVSWNVLPAVRREMTNYLINEKNVSRKTVAKKLGLTESAVCQYVKNKRGGSYKFSSKNLVKIRKLADLLMESDKKFDCMCYICKELDSPEKTIREAKKANS